MGFARRAILNVLRLADSDEFKLMVGLLLKVGFGLSNIFFEVEVGWWNRLGIDVIRLRGYYYRSIDSRRACQRPTVVHDRAASGTRSYHFYKYQNPSTRSRPRQVQAGSGQEERESQDC